MCPSSFLMALAAAIGVTANPFTSAKYAESAKVHAYLDSLVPVALDVLAHQIGGPSIGTDPGVLIALIPEEAHPDSNICWLRDACVGYIAWLAELGLKPNETASQHVISMAGNIFTGRLEEALFDLHVAQITVSDERIRSPAADGPPLRAVTLIKYAEWLLRQEQNNGTWDLWWVPVWDGSYWTSSVQYRALRAGARLSREIGREGDTISLQSFWNSEKGFVTETTVTNVYVVGDAFKELFPINQVLPANQSPFFGFFLDDKLYGGQVQYFASFNVAEQTFDALLTWNILGWLGVTVGPNRPGRASFLVALAPFCKAEARLSGRGFDESPAPRSTIGPPLPHQGSTLGTLREEDGEDNELEAAVERTWLCVEERHSRSTNGDAGKDEVSSM
ncbi:hypothetical protein BJV78DRAFT_1356153 [Lactifluus subvellereus]|nr:hypothetical protein BJV78DRAFT_1356153 [Lactifluus subvellereus]